MLVAAAPTETIEVDRAGLRGGRRAGRVPRAGEPRALRGPLAGALRRGGRRLRASCTGRAGALSFFIARGTDADLLPPAAPERPTSRRTTTARRGCRSPTTPKSSRARASRPSTSTTSCRAASSRAIGAFPVPAGAALRPALLGAIAAFDERVAARPELLAGFAAGLRGRDEPRAGISRGGRSTTTARSTSASGLLFLARRGALSWPTCGSSPSTGAQVADTRAEIAALEDRQRARPTRRREAAKAGALRLQAVGARRGEPRAGAPRGRAALLVDRAARAAGARAAVRGRPRPPAAPLREGRRDRPRHAALCPQAARPSSRRSRRCPRIPAFGERGPEERDRRRARRPEPVPVHSLDVLRAGAGPRRARRRGRAEGDGREPTHPDRLAAEAAAGGGRDSVRCRERRCSSRATGPTRTSAGRRWRRRRDELKRAVEAREAEAARLDGPARATLRSFRGDGGVLRPARSARRKRRSPASSPSSTRRSRRSGSTPTRSPTRRRP